MPKPLTLEEIGRRALALAEARSAMRPHHGSVCERRYIGCGAEDDPDEGPCWLDGTPRAEWCDGCQRREELLAARRLASRRLTSATRSWMRNRG